MTLSRPASPPSFVALVGFVMVLALVASSLLAAPPAARAQAGFDVLVFSKTAGFRHGSIPDGIAALEALGAAHGFTVDATEDAGRFTAASLAPFEVVVFLSTTGDVLDASQQQALRDFVEAGGGWVGIHAAADTEYGWPWYGTLLGGEAWFLAHPAIQDATFAVDEACHPATDTQAATRTVREEWYNFQTNPRGAVTVLATVDESSYNPGFGAMGADHPVSWFHRVGEGRSFYTALGHRSQTFDAPFFRDHLLGALLWASGQAVFRDDFEAGGLGCWSVVVPTF